MTKVSADVLQKIKSSVNILEIVGQHVVLKKSGSNYSGLCPFHSERTPSFSVHEGKQLYHCYGCKKGGDLVRFMMEIYGIGFREAIEELAERAKIALPREWGSDSDDPEAEKRRDAQREKISTAYRLNRFVAQFYHQQLCDNREVQEYFRKRGVSDGVTGELARSFYIGMAPGGWDALANHLAAKKAPMPLASELGLIRPSQKGASHSATGYFDLFRNRAMFPILDMRGKVAGFGGRTLNNDDGPKYMNSPDSFVYQKSKLAFGLYQAQKHVREKNEIILVEGYFDVLALHAAGFQNVVATCGTALTPDHLNMFKRLADRVTILFDGDRAGIQATERGMELGLEHGQILWGAAMPEGLDPDEILFDQSSGRALPDGREKMEAILKDAQPLLDRRMEQACEYAKKSPESRTQAIKHVGHWLSIYIDPVGREVRMQSFAEKLGISRNLVLQAMGKAPETTTGPTPRGHNGGQSGGGTHGGYTHPAILLTPPQGSTQGAQPRPKPAKPPHKSELFLLRTLVRQSLKLPEFAASLHFSGDNLPPETTWADLFENTGVREFILKFTSSDLPPEQILESISDPALSSLVMEALIADETPPETSEIKNAMGRCISRLWARFSHKIKERLADAESRKDAELQAILMKEYLDVQRKMKELTTLYDEA